MRSACEQEKNLALFVSWPRFLLKTPIMSLLFDMLFKRLQSADRVILQDPPLNLEFSPLSDPSDPRLALSSSYNASLSLYRQMMHSLRDDLSHPTPQGQPLSVRVNISHLQLEVHHRIERVRLFMKASFDAISSCTYLVVVHYSQTDRISSVRPCWESSDSSWVSLRAP
jgi:hypothetical protein